MHVPTIVLIVELTEIASMPGLKIVHVEEDIYSVETSVLEKVEGDFQIVDVNREANITR